jgi:hypothetical protein
MILKKIVHWWQKGNKKNVPKSKEEIEKIYFLIGDRFLVNHKNVKNYKHKKQ